MKLMAHGISKTMTEDPKEDAITEDSWEEPKDDHKEDSIAKDSKADPKENFISEYPKRSSSLRTQKGPNQTLTPPSIL